jgi:hypothetical protein
MANGERTCGEELSASAEVPEAIGALLGHVAINLREHAAWVGAGSEAAEREKAALRAVADAYEEIAHASERAAMQMRAFRELSPCPHDAAALDRAKLAAWMRKKLVLQRALAELLLSHARLTEQGLEQLANDLATKGA